MSFVTTFNESKGYYELWSNGISILNEGNHIQGCIDFTVEPNDEKAFNTIVTSKVGELPNQVNLFCFPLGYDTDGFTIMGINRKGNFIGIGYTTVKCVSSYCNENADFVFSTPILLKGIAECTKSVKGIELVSENESEGSIELKVKLPIKNEGEPISQVIKRANRKLRFLMMRVNLYLAMKVLASSAREIAKKIIIPDFYSSHG